MTIKSQCCSFRNFPQFYNHLRPLQENSGALGTCLVCPLVKTALLYNCAVVCSWSIMHQTGAALCLMYTVNVAEPSDAVYLLTNDEDARDQRWTVATSATQVKSSSDSVSFQLGKLFRGRSVYQWIYFG